jgi:hypothetical protein
MPEPPMLSGPPGKYPGSRTDGILACSYMRPRSDSVQLSERGKRVARRLQARAIRTKDAEESASAPRFSSACWCSRLELRSRAGTQLQTVARVRVVDRETSLVSGRRHAFRLPVVFRLLQNTRPRVALSLPACVVRRSPALMPRHVS